MNEQIEIVYIEREKEERERERERERENDTLKPRFSSEIAAAVEKAKLGS